MESNIIELANNNLYAEIMELDLATMQKRILDRKDSKQKISGHYVRKGDDLILLYRNNWKDGVLYFNVNDREISLDDPDVSVSFIRRDTNNIFTVINKDEVFYQITYPSYRFDPVNMADFEFDDWHELYQDFFLFLYYLMQQPDKKNTIYTPGYY
jgi:hypothetical protein